MIDKDENVQRDMIILPGGAQKLNVKQAKAIEDLAMFTARLFIMPNSDYKIPFLRHVLTGLARGICQLVLTYSSSENLLAFIPFPILNGSRPEKLYPCGEALYQLTDAIKKLHFNQAGQPKRRGKDFEEVAAMAM